MTLESANFYIDVKSAAGKAFNSSLDETFNLLEEYEKTQKHRDYELAADAFDEAIRYFSDLATHGLRNKNGAPLLDKDRIRSVAKNIADVYEIFYGLFPHIGIGGSQ